MRSIEELATKPRDCSPKARDLVTVAMAGERGGGAMAGCTHGRLGMGTAMTGSQQETSY